VLAQQVQGREQRDESGAGRERRPALVAELSNAR
jgi:hypothetical protein